MRGLGLPHAASRRRIGFVEMRDHFSRAALTGDPTEIMRGIGLFQAFVGDKRAEAVPGNRAHDGAVPARSKSVCAHEAIGELDRIAAFVLEAPMAAVAFHRGAARGPLSG